VLIPETRHPIVSYDPSRRQSRLCRARGGHITENGRKGSRKGRFCSSSLAGLSHPGRIWLSRRSLVARRTPTASVDMGLLAAFRLRISCGYSPVEFPCAPDNYWLLRILGFFPKFRRDGKVSSFTDGCTLLLDPSPIAARHNSSLSVHSMLRSRTLLLVEHISPFVSFVSIESGLLLSSGSFSIQFQILAALGLDSLCFEVQQHAMIITTI
jgi:hypothetical protein